ncbi:FAD-dependent monooxygenase [Actinomadura spongiicola]|uniref:FAD-dependent monooxygenase n=1 Tax=Actinomadura spongiicola TaxID=2303421 RepID=UPI00131404F3|nr:FAD-dependent monooxygenase [Actinomadura spongiicola]
MIVGAGPAGLMLGCELALAGVTATILERRPAPRTDSPGAAVNAGAVEALELRGLMDRLRHLTFPLPMIHFSLLFLEMEKVDERAKGTLLLQQTQLERVLEERATELGVKILRDHEVTRIDQDDDGVTALVRTPGGIERIECGYLVGADGADGAVRRLAGIPLTGAEIAFYGITGDLEISMEELGPLPLGAAYYPAGGQWMCAPIGPDVMRVTTAEFDIEPADPTADVTVEEFRMAVRRLTGAELTAGKPRWLSRTDCRIAQAEAYRRGRVLLAGDAACVIYPVNGQALANALHDALNLGWKLAAQVQGWAPPGLLDSYHDERHAVGRRACDNVRAQVTLSRGHEEVGAVRDLLGQLMRFDEVNRYLAGMLSGVDTAYEPSGAGPAERHPLTGTRPSPDLWVASDDGDSPAAGAAESLRQGRGVVLYLDGDPDRPGPAAAWSSRVDQVRVSRVPGVDADVVLLRPDGHVAWACRGDGAGLNEALSTWFGAPSTEKSGAS